MTKKLTIKQIEEDISNMSLEESIFYIKNLEASGELSAKSLLNKLYKKKDTYDKEISRFNDMCKYEEAAFNKGIKFVAGIDEAGRGPLAGPVVAASVILPQNIFIKGLNDSKKLTPKQRDELYDIIVKESIAFSVGIVDEKCIDQINILKATIKAMEMAVDNLSVKPELLLIDAQKIGSNITQIPIIKGDTLSISIAAASIIAKVTRDRMIDEFDTLYPEYGFKKHKGYGTKDHIDAIKKHGICHIHRVTFTKKFIS